MGLNGILFWGNKGIESLYMGCRASNYVFKGINHINHLAFDESDSDFNDLESIHFSSRERIDSYFDNAQHHWEPFLQLRHRGGYSFGNQRGNFAFIVFDIHTEDLY